MQSTNIKHVSETMYYKDAKERQAVPKQLMEAYLEVKANVENKRKKIQQGVSGGIFSFIFFPLCFHFFLTSAKKLLLCMHRNARNSIKKEIKLDKNFGVLHLAKFLRYYT